MVTSTNSIGICLVQAVLVAMKHEWLLNVVHLTPINYESLQR